ncbi:MAG: sulfotransferase [Myxococcota bacterium]|nr:sulfotransferase [Myxococcota bacterium]
MSAEFMTALSLGRQHLRHERWSEASTELLRAVESRPEAWAVRGLLGGTLLKAGRPHDAIRELTRTLSEQPDDLPARLHLGMALLNTGQNAGCEAAMRAVLAKRPDEIVAWRYLIAACHRLGQLAIQARTRLTELVPEEPDAWAGLGAAWLAKGAPQPAITCFRRVLALQPNDLTSKAQLGLLLLDVGALDESEVLLQAVRAEVPMSSSVLVGLARIRHWNREWDKAKAMIAPLLVPPVSSMAALALWAELNPDQPEAVIPLLVSALEQSDLTDSTRCLLLHRLGDLRDAAGSHDAAFAAWRSANDLRNLSFDPVGHDRAIDALIDGYRGPQVRSQCDSEVPVFIVGMPRSGTSLLEQMLDRHPEIVGAGELESIRQIAQQLSKPSDYYLRLEQIAAPQLTKLSRAHLAHLQTLGGGARRVVDKMPNNFLHLGLISQLFPRARVLHLVRDPSDTCLSCFRQRLGAGLSHTTKLEWLGAYFKSYARLMEHWEAVLPITIQRVHYADLVREPETTLRSVCTMLGVEFDARCLTPHLSKRLVKTASRIQVQQPPHTHAIGRAAPYMEHLTELHRMLNGEA